MLKRIQHNIGRAVEIVSEHGISTLLIRIRRRLGLYFAYVSFIIETVLRGTHVVSLNGVRLDVGAADVAPKVFKRIYQGGYERAEAQLIQDHIVEGVPTVDLGAGLGYSTCLLERQTGDAVTLGVEANPSLEPHLERTKNLNEADFDIVITTYGSTGGNAEFHFTKEFWSASLYNRENATETVTVRTRSLEDLLSQHSIDDRFQLVSDIEGAEHDLITTETALLRDRCERLLIEFHQFTDHDEGVYRDILEKNNFEHVTAVDGVHLFVNTGLSR